MILISYNPVFAVANTPSTDISMGINKIVIAMIGVVIFSVVTFCCLTLYNKFFVPKYIKNVELEDASLNRPVDLDDAVRKFINRNRLR